MRAVATLLTTFLVFGSACTSPSTYPSTQFRGDPLREVESLGWMAGSWVDESGNYRWEEHWSEPLGGTMLGMSRMVRAGQTMFTESVRIEERGGRIVYVVTPSGLPTVEFLLIEHGGWQALFQNPNNAAPHTIGYRLQPDGSLLSWTVTDKDGQEVKEFFPKEPASLVRD